MSINMVVFDMAGTSVDENNVVYKTLQKVINDAGHQFTLADVLRLGAGKEKLQAIKDILAADTSAHASLATTARLYQSFEHELAEAYNNIELKPQPGAEQLFQELKNRQVKVVLNTGYNKATATAILHKLNWIEGQHYDALITASDVNQNRPHPDMIALAMQQLHISDPMQVVKVGDSIIDIEEGKNAHCKYSIGITTGAHTKQQLLSADPDFIIDHLSELLPIIS